MAAETKIQTCARCGLDRRADCNKHGRLPVQEPEQLPFASGFIICPNWTRSMRQSKFSAEWPLPARVAGARFDTGINPGECAIVQRWTEEYLSTGIADPLFINGSVGPGKSWLSAAACLHAFRRAAKTFAFVQQGRLLDMIIDSFRSDSDTSEFQILDDMAEPDILVIDDFAEKDFSNWSADVMFKIIENRHSEQRPIIATSNRPTKALLAMKDRDGSAIHRIAPMMDRLSSGTHITMTGPSLRGKERMK